MRARRGDCKHEAVRKKRVLRVAYN